MEGNEGTNGAAAGRAKSIIPQNSAYEKGFLQKKKDFVFPRGETV